MKRAWFKLALGILACFFLIGYGVGIAQDQTGATESQQNQTVTQAPTAQAGAGTSPQPQAAAIPEPLQAEATVAEHWSKNPYPRTIPAGSRLYIVVKHDTLWDIAHR